MRKYPHSRSACSTRLLREHPLLCVQRTSLHRGTLALRVAHAFCIGAHYSGEGVFVQEGQGDLCPRRSTRYPWLFAESYPLLLCCYAAQSRGDPGVRWPGRGLCTYKCFGSIPTLKSGPAPEERMLQGGGDGATNNPTRRPTEIAAEGEMSRQ